MGMYTARVARVQCVLTAELFTTRCGMAGSYAFACENTYEVLDFVGTNRNNMIESSSSLIILYLIMQIRRSQINKTGTFGREQPKQSQISSSLS